ncbi:hypothetical protein ABZX77_49090 [Streptomyces sp. NPDC004237]|uniref:hypothetical protein n=1 Tax=Streptomyces sp. NPDC004237 TaxID=3154455 RepID=UPI0033BB3849
MSHWIYELSGSPEAEGHQRMAGEPEPGKVVVFERAEKPGIVDGFVRESVDDLMMVARFRWVAGGDPSVVMPELLRAAAISP